MVEMSNMMQYDAVMLYASRMRRNEKQSEALRKGMALELSSLPT